MSIITTVSKNGSFEQGWTDLTPPPEAPRLTNQEPKDWAMDWVSPGQTLFGTNDVARGVPECVHKLDIQLPEHQREGKRDALILDGTTTYKIFHNGAAFGATLVQGFSGLPVGSIVRAIVPVRMHVHNTTTEVYAAESGAWLTQDFQDPETAAEEEKSGGWVGYTAARRPYVSGADAYQHEGRWFFHGDSSMGQYGTDILQITVPASGRVYLWIRVKSKWDIPVDFFIDDVAAVNVKDSFPPDPPSEVDEGHSPMPYKKVYHVVDRNPDNTLKYLTPSEYDHVIAKVKNSGNSFGSSWHDACIGSGLAAKTVIGYNVPLEEQAKLKEWRSQYFPSVELSFQLVGGAVDPNPF